MCSRRRQSHVHLGVLLFRVVQILIQNLGHGEHVDSVLLEYSTHGVVTANLTAVTRVLKFVLSNVLPDPFDGLWARELV